MFLGTEVESFLRQYSQIVSYRRVACKTARPQSKVERKLPELGKDPKFASQNEEDGI